jgi:hypothetical protein
MARRRELLLPLLGPPTKEVPVLLRQLWTDDHASLFSITH